MVVAYRENWLPAHIIARIRVKKVITARRRGREAGLRDVRLRDRII
jgi:lambda repressor-like predicted transcriptional regulator